MKVEEHIKDWLLADPLIAAQVVARVYPVKLPQNPTLPAITYQRISGVSYPPLTGRASLARPRYQFDVWVREGVGSAFKTSQTIGRLVRRRLDGQHTTVSDDSVSPAVPRQMWFEVDSDRDLFEPDTNGGFYRYSLDVFVWHQQSRT